VVVELGGGVVVVRGGGAVAVEADVDVRGETGGLVRALSAGSFTAGLRPTTNGRACAADNAGASESPDGLASLDLVADPAA
jgi:hypothetical protein